MTNDFIIRQIFTGISADTTNEVATDKAETTIFGTPQIFPLKFKLPSESNWWLFPVEPKISVEGKKIIAKRNVAKKRNESRNMGTIKEYWTLDDYTINISGLFTNDKTTQYPWADLNKLKSYCEAQESIEVQCRLLNELNITHIVIESYSLPFTKGNENQNFTINAVSDKPFIELFTPLPKILNE